MKVSHLKSRVIDQVKKELGAKSRISFKAELFKTGRKIQGWKFKVIDNKPKSERAKGAVSLPEAAEMETAKDRATIQGNESAMVRGKPRTEGSLVI